MRVNLRYRHGEQPTTAIRNYVEERAAKLLKAVVDSDPLLEIDVTCSGNQANNQSCEAHARLHTNVSAHLHAHGKGKDEEQAIAAAMDKLATQARKDRGKVVDRLLKHAPPTREAVVRV